MGRFGSFRGCDEHQRRPSDGAVGDLPTSADAPKGLGQFQGAAGAAPILAPGGGPDHVSNPQFLGQSFGDDCIQHHLSETI